MKAFFNLRKAILLTFVLIFLILTTSSIYAQETQNDDPLPTNTTRTVKPIHTVNNNSIHSATNTLGADIVLVVDRSGSMDDDGFDNSINDFQPIGSTKLAAIRFVSFMNLNSDRVALVSFNEVPKVNIPLIQNNTNVISGISSLTASGATDIASAINVAANLLSANNTLANTPVIIVLSDGQNNAGPDPVIVAANLAKAKGIRIFGIGLGSNIDGQTLIDASSSPNDYYFAPSVVDLENIYKKIARGIKPSPQGTLKLSIRDAYHANDPIALGVSVSNPTANTVTYQLVIELVNGSTQFPIKTEDVLIAFGSTRDLIYEFGTLDTNLVPYEVIASLYQNGSLLVKQKKQFTVGSDFYQANTAANQLKFAANEEIRQIENLLTQDLSEMALLLGKEGSSIALDLISSKVVPFVKSSDLPITADAFNNAITAVVDEFLLSPRWGEAINAPNKNLRENTIRTGIVKPQLNPTLDKIEQRHVGFVDNATAATFQWDKAWNAEVALSTDHINSRVEEERGAYNFVVGLQWAWPPIKINKATLAEMNLKFDWFASENGGQKWLGGLSSILLALLIVIALVVIIVFVLEPTPAGEGALIALFIKIKTAGELIGAISLIKSAAVIAFIFLFAALYFFSGVGPIANSVDSGHSNAVASLWSHIDHGLRITDLNSRVQVQVDSNEVKIQKHPEQDVFVYTPYGSIVERFTGENVEGELHLSAGKYTVVTFQSKEETGQQEYVQINSSDLKLEVTVPDPIRSTNLNFSAYITIVNTTNNDTSLYLVATTLSGEAYNSWDFQLSANQSQFFQYDFELESSGAQILRVALADENSKLTEEFVSLVVGEAPNFLLNLDLSESYAPLDVIVLPATIRNRGNLNGQALVEVKIYDPREVSTPILTMEHHTQMAPETEEQFTIDLSQIVKPGRYELFVYINGSFYETRSFVKEATDVLYLVPEETGRSVGASIAEVIYQIVVRDKTLSPIDAQVMAKVLTPDGKELLLAGEQQGTGLYQFRIPTEFEGTYQIHIDAQRDGWRIVPTQDFLVKRIPGFIYTNIIGTLANNRTRPLQVEITNELGQPIPDVSVIISSTMGTYFAQSNQDGVAEIILNPGTSNVEVTIEKLGYATTRYMLETIGDTLAQDIWLTEGWNLVSFNRMPPVASVDTVVGSMRLDLDRILSFESGPLSYYPTLPSAINTLQELDPYHGYWIKTNRSLVWPVDGSNVTINTSIPLEVGWNLVSFLPEQPLQVDVALVSLQGKYEFVRGYEGEALSFAAHLPSDLASLKTMKPGLGYWIKMNEAGKLTYPVIKARSEGMTYQPNIYASSGSPITKSRIWMDIYATNVKWNAMLLNIGSVVTVVDSSGTIVGQTVVRQQGMIGLLPIYGDDPETSIDEGASVGDNLTILINGFEMSLTQQLTWQGDGALSEIPLTNNNRFYYNHHLYLPLIEH